MLYLLIAVLAMSVFAPVAVAAPYGAPGPKRQIKTMKSYRHIPRYEKTKAQCLGFQPCLRDYYQRQVCQRMPRYSTRQNACYVRYAARYYDQDPNQALATAKCESYDRLDRFATSNGFNGIFQFVMSTYYGTPQGKRVWKVVAVLASNGQKVVRKVWRPRHNVYIPKYNALAAMWMWRQGRRSEWPVCG